MNSRAPIDALAVEETIFNAAVQLCEPAKRAAYLDLACESAPELRARIEKLLTADALDAKSLRNRTESEEAAPNSGPALAEAPEAVPERIGRYRLLQKIGEGGLVPPKPEPNSQGAAEVIPERIDHYKLLQKIGEGGCGVVYMAEQEGPVRRRVALKIIKLGMETKSVIARFEAERQALAMMEHPNIAKVYDAGATETGRPYFVMELVRGVKITDYCDEKNLTTRQRLDLFIQVCQAIQHAHQKGIIHRDIKPSNILVTQNDGVAVPKVIDFGIAKAINDQRLTDKTVFTAFEQFIGTPAHMSPEQAEISSVDIDTRSDIYSLGVLLYELLTGKTPFDAKELLQAGLDEMRRTIREKEPARPSTRVSTLGGDELTTTAQRRGLEPPKLVSTLRGDLDWIAMKCLEKQRARRYETVNGLAMDIQRHLKNEPVVASPPSHLYKFQKFVRRNRAAVSVACTSLGCLIIALGGVTWGFLNERELRAKEHALVVTAQTAATISSARQAYQESRRDEAEKLLDQLPFSAIKPDPTHAAVRRSLGWWHAIHQEWERAASNLALLPRLDAPNDRAASLFQSPKGCLSRNIRGPSAICHLCGFSSST